MAPPPHFDNGPEVTPGKYTWAQHKALLKTFFRYYLYHKGLSLTALGIIVLTPVFSTVRPALVYRCLDKYLPDRNLSMLYVCIGGIVLLTLLNIFFEYVRGRWVSALGVRMETNMRTDMFQHIQKLSFSYFDRTKTAHIMSRITNDLSLIAGVASNCPGDLISAVLLVFGGMFVMYSINPWLALFMLVPMPAAVFWAWKLRPALRNIYRKIREDVAEVNSQVENSVQGIREVKSYTNEALEQRKFDGVNERYREAQERGMRISALFHCGMMFFFHGYSMMFIGIGILMIYYGKATSAQVLTFFLYSHQVTMPIIRMAGCFQQYLQGLSAYERFYEVMQEVPEIQDAPHAIQSFDKPLKGKIEIRNVSFKYPDMKEEEPLVLDHINLDIPAGSTLAVVGESGAGKTTLAGLIPRFYEVCEGDILLDGISIRNISQSLLRKNVGIVQQSPFLFDTTIRENILFGKPDASEEELRTAARLANIADFIESLPDGYDSRCGENGVRLSGGQKQRISIARVFLKNPPVLIFDEATSALDNQSEALVQESMDRLCTSRTTIIIAHRLSTVKNADRICCMRHGKVVEFGTHEELLAANGYYKELYTMHSF